MENEKKKGKGSLVVIIILLLIIIGLCGFICYDKFLSNNSKVDAEVDNKETKKEVETDTDTDKEETEEATTVEEDTNGYVEKVYSWSENNTTRTIVLFKSGSCVSTSNYEYTAHCTYKIDNNKLILTTTKAGISRGEEYVINYLITHDESNQEIIKQEDHPEIVLKYLK